MPIIKSAIKRVRQQAKRRSLNLGIKRTIHRDIRELSDAIEKKDTAAATEALQKAISEIDRAVKKNTIHKNTAARRKSQLQKQLNALVAPVKTKGAAKPKAKPAAKKAPAKTAAKKPATKTTKKATK